MVTSVLEEACSGNALDVLERDTPYDFLFKTTFPLPYGAHPSKNILAVAKQFAQGDVGGVAVEEKGSYPMTVILWGHI